MCKSALSSETNHSTTGGLYFMVWYNLALMSLNWANFETALRFVLCLCVFSYITNISLQFLREVLWLHLTLWALVRINTTLHTSFFFWFIYFYWSFETDTFPCLVNLEKCCHSTQVCGNVIMLSKAISHLKSRLIQPQSALCPLC